VTLELENEVATITMDDGKMNAFGFDLIRDVSEAMDSALEQGAGAVVVAGNKKAFSAGFDLAVMGKGTRTEQAALFEKGSELILKFFTFPRPLVIASEGHGLALGGILLLAADIRIGSNLPKHKYGLNEVAIGMSVPVSGIEIARHRMPKKYLQRATTYAELFSGEQAVEVGYLDQAVEPAKVLSVAKAEAARVASLKNPGFVTTKHFERGAAAQIIRDTMWQEVQRLKGKSAKL